MYWEVHRSGVHTASQACQNRIVLRFMGTVEESLMTLTVLDAVCGTWADSVGVDVGMRKQ